ncbi:CHAT domain-containing protein [Thermosynechococcus sp. GLH187]|uniref:CHAT domain-containing protein n=1 Tax=unclassified Thermosynechococcus TaxID=2622553 RepID=UPI002877C6F9|nr:MULTISPECIES: CHAT domain-containing protein [unclassified Thermosynechococcus]WNC46340.1 CHAT domain-containing protein [Thermosynechococcus sp. GLH187]WNC48877.1 CHAT domain-containing protein [Thermosynechococcus sp. GLH333]WNC51410.1 CHAT domain-containing protein [Thermosynechococcus sp. GLH87]
MKTLQQYLFSITLVFWGLLSGNVYSQITPATNGTGTTVIQNGQQIDIGGGSLSGNGQNLFHLFRDFNISNGQVANFLSNPQIRNILAGVNGGNASYINGLIQITGGNSNLYLLNPAGIVFGPNARLNLPAAFHASTAQRVLFEGGIFDVNGQNLYQSLNGQPTGFEFLSKGLIINEGELRVGRGQTLSLMAHQVINTGTLAAPAGNIHIAAVPETGMVRVSQEGMLLSLEIPQERLPTGGAIAAVDLPSLLTGNGSQPVNSVIQNPDGTIRLVHDPNKIPTTTNTAVISGSLSVANPIGMGGQITITGQNIALINANLTASGQLGGGTILLGGDYLGGTTGTNRLHSSFNAQNLFINSGSVIAADAFNQGNGGTVIAWADNSTQFAGTISARGGQLSGNGGFVETSGRELLSVRGTVDASAVKGQPGTWLLDPRNVTISNSPTSGGSFSGSNPDVFTPTTDDAFVVNTAIEAALNLGTSVIITTGDTGTQAGDISVLASITKIGGGDASLTLQAANNILVADDIRSEEGRLNIILHADADNSGAGAIRLDSVTLITNGGNIILGGGSNPFTSPAIGVSTAGVNIGNSTLNAGGGHIRIHGSGATTNGQEGVLIGGSSILTSGSGEITILGTGSSSVYSPVDGISIQNSSISAEAGNLTLTGTGGNVSEGVSNVGIHLEESGIRTTTGNITLTGTGGTGFAFNQGGILSRFTSITSQSGDIILRGTGGEFGAGLGFKAATDTEYSAEVRTAGNGKILIEGRATDGNPGLVMEVSDAPLTLAVQDGMLTLAAQGGIEVLGDLLDIHSAGAGRLVFQPIDAHTPVGIGDGATGNLIIDQSLLNQITGGFSLVTIGHPNGTGLIDVRPFSLNYNLALQTPGVSSLGIQFNGSGTTNLNGRNLTLNSGGGVTQGSHVISAGTLQLLGQGTFTLNNVNNRFQTLSGNVSGNVNLSNQGALGIVSFNNGVNGLTTGINTNGNTLILSLNSGNLTQSAPIRAGNLGLTLQNGSAILTNPNNQVGILAAELNSASDLQFVNNSTLTVGSVNPTGITGRNIFLQTLTGDIVLNAPISAVGTGDAIVLAAENNFINNYGSSVFSTPNGRWLVYSTDPNLNINGGLTGSEQFNTTYPELALFSGSGFLYRVSQAPPTPPTEPSTPPTPPTPPTEPSTPPTPPEPQTQENLGRILLGEEIQGTQLPQNTAQVIYFPGVEIIRQQISTAFDQGDYNSAIKLLQQLYSFEFSEYFDEFFSTPSQEGLQFLDIEQIKELLGRMAEETGQKPALSYVFWRPEQLDILIITPEGEPIYQPLRVPQEAVRRVIAAFNREVRDPTKTNSESYLPFAQQLYQWIMGGIDAELQNRGINTLVFALDQGLRSVPIAALHTGSNLISSTVSDSPIGRRNGQFLVERYNLGLIPSINLVDTRYQPLQNASVLAMGASQFTKQSPLPAVPIELQTITQLVGRGQVFLNEAFTVSNLQTQRRRSLYPILHLATHGEFNAGKPQNSYIQFWDSQLSMAQVRQLHLFRPPTELMTLSACRTAVGDTNAELGFAGLSLQAGVKSSVASLWYVSDEGTLALMTAFYGQLRTAPIKAEALRQAQLALIHQQVVIEENHLRSAGVRGGLSIPLPQEVQTGGGRQLSHPYFWAGFTMIGSPW